MSCRSIGLWFWGSKKREGLLIATEDGRSRAGEGSRSLWWTPERAVAEELH